MAESNIDVFQKNPCVMQDWLISELSWRQQTVLFTALRGPDGLPKSNAGKLLCRYLRSCILRDATPSRGTFMGVALEEMPSAAKNFLEQHDEYPHHFIMHLIHSAEILGYKHPDPRVKDIWQQFYLDCCASMHMTPETETEMDTRLKDDM